MAWLESFTLVMRSSIATLREKIEDPERMLYQLIIDMEEELDRVRECVAGAIADEIQLGRKAEQARDEAAQWLERASSSLRRGDEGQAQAALEQKGLAEQRAERLAQEFAKQKEETAKLQRAVADLEDKIRQARQKQTLLLARLARANTAARVQRAMDCAGSRSAFAQFSRLEQRVERAEAMDEARARLDGRDPDAEELARRCAESERKERLARELTELKQRMSEQP